MRGRIPHRTPQVTGTGRPPSADRRSATVQAHTSPPQFTAAFHSKPTGTRSPARLRGCRYSPRPERTANSTGRSPGNTEPTLFVDQGEGRKGSGCEDSMWNSTANGTIARANWDGGAMRDFTWAERSARLVGGGGGDLLGRAGEARIRVLTGSQAAKRNPAHGCRRRLTARQVPDTPEGPDRGDHRHPQPPPSRTPAPPRNRARRHLGGISEGRRPPEAQ